ncbi:hypothetical protein B0H11DRAFT_1909914 [Mycena galericulata]|nr:hypothetical protein B0H11DRAFT_1909914 [Mycena galericulata]
MAVEYTASTKAEALRRGAALHRREQKGGVLSSRGRAGAGRRTLLSAGLLRSNIKAGFPEFGLDLGGAPRRGRGRHAVEEERGIDESGRAASRRTGAHRGGRRRRGSRSGTGSSRTRRAASSTGIRNEVEGAGVAVAERRRMKGGRRGGTRRTAGMTEEGEGEKRRGVWRKDGSREEGKSDDEAEMRRTTGKVRHGRELGGRRRTTRVRCAASKWQEMVVVREHSARSGEFSRSRLDCNVAKFSSQDDFHADHT